ncbi:MAG TPA: OB-fold domain-containing protein [Acidimicrobiia bacterium]|nr:OB-fold domain-containing protein [Acidimicrobiia bacterium]
MAPGTSPPGGEPEVKLVPGSLIVLTPDSWTLPFWEAAAEHRLVVPRCTRCGTFRMPPSPFCWNCQHQDVEWLETPGRGTVYSFTVVWHPLLPDLGDAVPYVPAVVTLPDAGGVRLVGGMVGVRPSEVRIGLEVELVWRDVREGTAVPTWRPVRSPVDGSGGPH